MRLEANVTIRNLAILAPGTLPVIGMGKRRHEGGSEASVSAAAQAEAALTTVYLQYSATIHSYAFRLLGNQEDADDVTQEVFIRVHARLDQLRDSDRLRPWLYRIATNLCLDQLRRRSRARRTFGLFITLGSSDSEGDDTREQEVAHPSSTAAIDGVAERDHISQALRRMPPKYSTCLVLHSAQGLSYREIAEILDITPGAAAVRLARARDLFGRYYEELRGEEK